MPCYHPIRGWLRAPGENGRRPVAFSPDGFLNPDDTIGIPCGQCVGCKLERKRQWAVRIMHETLFHPFNYFLTLTLEDYREVSLWKPHFQGFMKNLRSSLPGHKFKYFMCGEYGEKLQRPHYHAVLMGDYRIPDEELWKKSNGHPVTRSNTIEKLWTTRQGRDALGMVFIGSVTPESAAYVAGYVEKKQVTKEIKLGLQPEYVAMSKGIGAEYFEKYAHDVYSSDSVVVNGKEWKPPRYYDKLLEKIAPDGAKAVSQRRIAKAQENPERSYWQRLLAGEKIALQKIKPRSYAT